MVRNTRCMNEGLVRGYSHGVLLTIKSILIHSDIFHFNNLKDGYYSIFFDVLSLVILIIDWFIISKYDKSYSNGCTITPHAVQIQTIINNHTCHCTLETSFTLG
jgi:hypothetical protein